MAYNHPCPKTIELTIVDKNLEDSYVAVFGRPAELEQKTYHNIVFYGFYVSGNSTNNNLNLCPCFLQCGPSYSGGQRRNRFMQGASLGHILKHVNDEWIRQIDDDRDTIDCELCGSTNHMECAMKMVEGSSEEVNPQDIGSFKYYCSDMCKQRATTNGTFAVYTSTDNQLCWNKPCVRCAFLCGEQCGYIKIFDDSCKISSATIQEMCNTVECTKCGNVFHPQCHGYAGGHCPNDKFLPNRCARKSCRADYVEDFFKFVSADKFQKVSRSVNPNLLCVLEEVFGWKKTRFKSNEMDICHIQDILSFIALKRMLFVGKVVTPATSCSLFTNTTLSDFKTAVFFETLQEHGFCSFERMYVIQKRTLF